MRFLRAMAAGLLCLGAAAVMAVANAPAASAWTYNGCNIASASVHYAFGSGAGSTYQSAMTSAKAAWNATTSPAYFQLQNGTVTLGIDAYSWGSGGLRRHYDVGRLRPGRALYEPEFLVEQVLHQ